VTHKPAISAERQTIRHTTGNRRQRIERFIFRNTPPSSTSPARNHPIAGPRTNGKQRKKQCPPAEVFALPADNNSSNASDRGHGLTGVEVARPAGPTVTYQVLALESTIGTPTEGTPTEPEKAVYGEASVLSTTAGWPRK
jgi:hypothetical protein